MPSITAEEAPILKPFIRLADVLGAFVGQVTDEPIKEIEILYDGITAGMNTEIKALPVTRWRRRGRDFFRFFVFARERFGPGHCREYQSTTQEDGA